MKFPKSNPIRDNYNERLFQHFSERYKTFKNQKKSLKTHFRASRNKSIANTYV